MITRLSLGLNCLHLESPLSRLGPVKVLLTVTKMSARSGGGSSLVTHLGQGHLPTGGGEARQNPLED